jgi:Alginate export
MFAQIQSDFAPWRVMLTPADQDPLGLEQAFVVVTPPLDGGTLKLRVGRQQMAFDLQRFVSVRDGANVRQSYDAAWADYENGLWRIISFYGQPVQTRDGVFDDYSSSALTYGGFRVERRFGSAHLSTYYSRFTQDNARFLSVSGNERRDILDVSFAGVASGFDWEIEAMGQTGQIANKDIRAWAGGSLDGYTFADIGWTPRLGLQFDTASGDKNPHGNVLETFNPLFPNGYYFTLAGYTGYVNLIHVKPSVTLHPTESLKLMLAIAAQWRQTTADAVYTNPNIPVPGTAGQPGLYTGTYGQLRLDWAMTSYSSFAVEAVHFAVGDVIRRAGGHDCNYLGVQLAYGW